MASIKINININTKEAFKEINKFSKQASTALGDVSVNTAKTNKSVASLASGFRNIAIVAKAAAPLIIGAFGGRALLNAIQSGIQEANRFEAALIGVRSVASNFGIESQDVTDRVKELASDGLVPVRDVATSLKNLLATGLNLDQATKLFLTFKDSASFGRQAALDLGEAISGASQGFKNQLSILVDNAGITKNLSILQKEYAASIGTTIGRLSEQQKVYANYVGLLREGAIFQGDAARLQETYSGATSRLSFAFDQFQVKLGQFITRSPALTKIVKALSNAFEGLTDILDENQDSIFRFVKETSVVFIKSFSAIIKTLDIVVQSVELVYDAFKSFFGNLIPFFIFKAGEKILSGLNIIIDDLNLFLKIFDITPIEKFTNSLENLKNAATVALDTAPTFALANQGILSDLAVGADQLAESLENAKISQSLDSLNKKVKEVGDTSLETKGKFSELGEESIEVIERIGSRFSTLSASISQSLGSVGQSISSALNFNFGTGADKQKAELDQLAKDLETAFKKQKISEEIYTIKKAELKKLRKDLSRNSQIALATGLANSIARGSKGAKDFVVGLGKAAANAILPGLGEAVGPLLDAFAQGPEEVKKLVNEFAQSLPQIVENIILSIPVFIEAIADNVDKIIIALVDRVDDIIIALVKAMPRVSAKLALALSIDVPIALIKSLPQVVVELVKAFVKEFPNAIIKAFKDAFSKLGSSLFKSLGRLIFDGFVGALTGGFSILGTLFKKIFKFDGGGRGAVEKFLGFDFPFIAFAQGGLVGGSAKVKGDSPLNDTVPALLSAGEIVLPRSAVQGGMTGIFSFLEGLGVSPKGFFLGGLIETFVGGLVGGIVGLLSGGSGLVSSIFDGAGNIVESVSNYLTQISDYAVNPKKYIDILKSLAAIGAEINLKDLVKNPLSAVSNAVKGALDFFQDSFREVLKGGLPFAQGGMVPRGFNNDNFPARLTSGEYVIDRSTTRDLNEFLSRQNNNDVTTANDSTVLNVLLEIANLMRQEKTIETSVDFDGDTLANIILNLNRTNARLA